MNTLMKIMIIINVVIFVCNIRHTFLALIGLLKAGVTYPATDQMYHFAILIPARNEEKCIGRLLDSLESMDYPQDLKSVFVILNGCTDRTGEIVREHGVPIIQCDAGIKNKASALRIGFDYLAGRAEIDAFVVFDADTVADAAFLKELNKTFAHGARMVQGNRRGLGVSQTWIAQSYEIYYAMQNSFFNHPRAVRELSVAINGSGWAVSREVIERYGFSANTLTEDIEYTLQAALEGETIAYCAKAVNYDDFVQGFCRSMKQRLRWTMGNTQCLRRYSGRLLSQACLYFRKSRRKALTCLDMLIVNMIPVAAALAILTGAVSFVCGLIMTVQGNMAQSTAVSMLILLLTGWLATGFMAAVALAKAHIDPLRCLKGVILFPLFLITWLPLVIISFFRREVRWAEMRK